MIFLSGDSDVDLKHVSELPSKIFFLGTDSLGRSLLSRLGMCVLTLVKIWVLCIFSGFLGVLLSLCLLIFPMWRRFLIFLGSVVQAVPFLVWVLLGSYGVGVFDFYSISLVSCLFFSVSCSSVIMKFYLEDQGLSYWECSQILGSSVWSQVWNHGLLRQWRDPLLLHVCQLMQRISIVEVSLSYLGLGVQEPESSFGNMIALQFPYLLRGDWWGISVILVIMIISLNVPMGFVTMSRHYKLL